MIYRHSNNEDIAIVEFPRQTNYVWPQSFSNIKQGKSDFSNIQADDTKREMFQRCCKSSVREFQ